MSAIKRSPQAIANIRAARMAVVPPLEVRFWSKVEGGDPEKCWPWRGHVQTRGYGQFHVGMVDGKCKRVPAHRIAWELHMGVPVPPGLVIDHICKNTICCNPHHLRPVRQYDNCMALASPTPFYRNAQAKTCPHGHPYNPENTAWPKKVIKGRERRGRICLVCHPTYWRWAQIPRPRPPGSRYKRTDPDFNQRPNTPK